MTAIKLVVSDLHLADGTVPLDCFGAQQQSAFEGLLAKASNGAASVELIINGDCFDFLATAPFLSQPLTDLPTALLKLEKIIAAHRPFFATLRAFLALPGHSLTFLTGNHDFELLFPGVRAHIHQALAGDELDAHVSFCATRSYRPLPDVYIEHGNQYDFWNCAPQGVWDEQGRPLLTDPALLPLPVGSLYHQRVTSLISLRYPYFDHFEPQMNDMRQIALLCLFDPTLILEAAQRTMQMLSYPRRAHEQLAPGEEQLPVRLFEETLQDFVAFRSDVMAQLAGQADATAPEISSQDMLEFMQVHAALSLTCAEAVAALFTTLDASPNPLDDTVTQGMLAVLKDDASLRYAIAGHTHSALVQPLAQGAQTYLNTASWTARYAQPTPTDVTSTLVAWLQQPDWQHIPLHDLTRLTFVLITADDAGPADAHLCQWLGGADGHYHILA